MLIGLGKLLEFDEDIVTIVPVLDIIRENRPKFMSSTANTDDDIIDPLLLVRSEYLLGT